MSQTPPRVCPTCQTPIGAGQRFCANCGSAVAEQSPTIAPTVASSLSNSGMQPPPPANAGYQPTTLAQDARNTPSSPNYNPTERASEPQIPSSGQGYQTYNTPPPPPSDPYGAKPAAGEYYASYTQPPVQAKKRSPWPLIIIGIIVFVLLVGGGGVYAITSALNNAAQRENQGTTGINSNTSSGGGGTYTATQKLNLSAVYASDQLTFTGLQQQAKFSDDDLANDYGLSSHPNYVRLSFQEQQTAKDGSFFAYTSAFHLILPDKSVANTINSEQDIAPDQDVTRNNWVDFDTSSEGEVDLSKLQLELGASDEHQMTFALANNANLTQYAPKTITLNKQTTYAGANWTIKDATQSLYFDGQQAKTGQVYITFDLVASNNSDNDVSLYDFLRLKAGASTISPDDNSNLDNFISLNAQTTNVQGSAAFQVQPTSTNTYTLDFLAGTDISAQTVNVQFS